MSKEGDGMHFESTVILDKEISTVYSMLVDSKNNGWRRNVKETKVIDATHYIEYTLKNYPTFFTVIKKSKNKLYCLEIINNKLEGMLTYEFVKKEKQTEISVSFDIQVLNEKSLFFKRKMKKAWQILLEDLKQLG